MGTTGTLQFRDGCLMLRLGDGTHVTIVGIEGRVRWDEVGESVAAAPVGWPDNGSSWRVFSVGDVVSVGGGGIRLDEVSSWAQEPPASCPGDGRIVGEWVPGEIIE